MGCSASKKESSMTPVLVSGAMSWDLQGSGEMLAPPPGWNRSESGESAKVSSLGKMRSVSTTRSWSANSTQLGNFHKQVEGEQAAAGSPAWLTAIAGEAIQGWVPLKADYFQKLEKIGEGTYSTIFRAREVDTGKIIALKKYFQTEPFACEPSSWPKYPPNKEMDAKGRESQRTSTTEVGNELETTKRPSRTSRASVDFNGLNKESGMLQKTRINHGDSERAINPPVENRLMQHMSRVDFMSGPLHFPDSSGFERARKQNDNAYSRYKSRQSSLSVLRARHGTNSEGKENGDVAGDGSANFKPHKRSEISNSVSQKQWTHYKRDAVSSTRSLLGYQDQVEKVEFSGPLLSRSNKVDEFLEKHERHIRQAVHRSVLHRGVK